jgi:hypothetical protein
VSVRVVGDYKDQLKLGKQWKYAKKNFIYYREKNQKRAAK